MDIYQTANRAIFKAYITSEAVIAVEKGLDPKDVISGRLAKIEHLSYVIGTLLLISRALVDNGVPCMDPLMGYKFNKAGSFNNPQAVKWREFYRVAITVRDAWEYVLTINDLNTSVVNKVCGFDRVFFEEVLSRSLTDFKRFAFYDKTQV